jgi:hypothetical protein
MPTISIMTYTDPSGPPHMHVAEDLTSQIDGYRFAFNVSQVYIPNSLEVVYNGVVYTKENDYSETGATEFTFVSDDPFPPEVGCPLVVSYRRLP